ncbi:MAG: AAA family ATPase [Candidatus Moraniibacteriota bacterium]
MYLKRIEITGFKSFANKTVLDFAPEGMILGGRAPGGDRDLRGAPRGEALRGITAIVGPNGSGKSNVADAIRWAIGEQSLKTLRGKKTEDVIFAGSGKKARLGSASVTLLFDNTDKKIPIEFDEVAIGRKVYRSGESEYLINGAKSRLSDVVDILAKAGVGKDSYCVVTQGMSDAILNATPLDRRLILEEAAGVKPYQLKKDRAGRKLDATLENIVRVEGLLVEIEPHMKNLRRQAEKASQGQVVADTLREKQLRMYGFLWQNFDRERVAIQTEEQQALARWQSREDETELLNTQLAEASKSFEQLQSGSEWEEEIRQEYDQLHRDEREVALIDGRIQAEEERRKPREEVRSVPVDLKYVREHLDEARTIQTQLIERLSTVEQLSELQELRELALVIQTRLHDLTRDVGKGAVITKRMVTLPSEELEASDEKLVNWKKEKVKRQQVITQHKEKIAKWETNITEQQRQTKALREQFFDLERQARARTAELNTHKDTLNDARVKLARVEVREEDLRHDVRQELAMDVSDLALVEGGDVDVPAVEREIARLKVQVEHIGSIDPMVLQEYEETRERYDFLSHESEDLKQAMASLQSIIREMDELIDATFENVFETINSEFQKHFSLIFGGGKASLELVTLARREGTEESEEANEDETDFVERESRRPVRGIEIAACPPGKKIHQLSMLSGGERSLTSLALLFAIIASNPPPFSVLDEVEAALDESNSRRFSRVLQEFSGRTQFVAITHNRETMRQASLLYGVTMGDDGVSKLFSVHLDGVESLKERVVKKA